MDPSVDGPAQTYEFFAAWISDRCANCDRLRVLFGFNYRTGVCHMCSIIRCCARTSAARDACCPAKENDGNALVNAVLRNGQVWPLLLEYLWNAKAVQTAWIIEAQRLVWGKVLKGNTWRWNFDCGHRPRHEFYGWFGEKSIHLVGPSSQHPLHLMVFYGVELRTKRKTSRFHHDQNILEYVIEFLGPYQPWMSVQLNLWQSKVAGSSGAWPFCNPGC